MKVVEFLQKTISGHLGLEQQKAYLLNHPFPDATELAKAVVYLRGHMPEAPKLLGAIDICGTGGSGLNRINTSTISAFVVAAAGVPIAKHGNNAATGRFGSFDLLSALDVPINLSNQELQLRFREYNLAFLYARNFYPIMKHFAPVRAELNRPTFFNLLGPLLSPVDAKEQIIGTSSIDNARLIARACKHLGKDHVIVISGRDGLDEITLSGSTHVVELVDNAIKEYDITPDDFGVKPVADFSEISAANAQDSLRFADDILHNRDKTRRTDLVLVNSALALCLAGKVKNYKYGYQLAKQILAKGLAVQTLENYRRPSVLRLIAARDASRNFAIVKPSDGEIGHKPRRYSGGLIAEIKQASPSEGTLKKNLNYMDLAEIYTRSGASAISVLTEPKDFNGSFDKFSKARAGTHLPLLCKDFILRTEHIDKAKSVGADMILLIVAMLDDRQLVKLYRHASDRKLQVLVEVHSEEELTRALKLKPKIIGVNSRNLHDFSIDRQLFFEITAKIPKGIIKVAESGIKNIKDIPEDYQGALVGSEIMKHPFPKLKIKELTDKPIIKLCGIRSLEQARLCESLGVDMIGVNFVPRSRRKVSAELAREISLQCTSTIVVGIFENQAAPEVNRLAEQAKLSAIQLSGGEENLENYALPIIKTIRPGETKPTAAFLTIIDAEKAGSGKIFDHSSIGPREPSLIAGGITLEIAKKLQKASQPLGFDTASGIESDGEVNLSKIEAFAKLFA